MGYGVVIGLSLFLLIVGVFLVHYIRTVLDSDDSTTIDKLPSDHVDQNM